jgi:ornithine cyclodeaminase/alanine dehydrogenase
MPPKVYLPLERHDGDFRAMPAYSAGAAGVKWVNAHPRNPRKHGLPAVMAVYIYSDPETARPLAVLDATLITAFRTGAAAAVATRHLARKGATSVGLVGCGVQARTALQALREVMKVADVRLADLSPEAMERLAREEGGTPGTVEAAAGCDVVVTTTPARGPVVRRGWVRPGTHLNAMGADAPGKQELDPRILQDARVFLDDMAQATESGEVNVPLHRGELRREELAGTLGEVVAGRIAGRRGDEITVFDSTGLALQDLAVARLLYEKARANGIGLEVDLVGA